MKKSPTDAEIRLASKVNDLEDAALRPTVAGGGLLMAATNFLLGKVSRGIIALCLVFFIFYQSWLSYNSLQQQYSELDTRRAEARSLIAEAISLNQKTKDKTNATALLESQIHKTESDAEVAEAEVAAAGHIVDGTSAQLAKLTADIKRTQAEAAAAEAEAAAQTQSIGELPAETAQKKAEVEAAEAKVAQALSNLRYSVKMAVCNARPHELFECTNPRTR